MALTRHSLSRASLPSPTRRVSIRQRYTEEAIEHAKDWQNVGNLKRAGTPEVGSADWLGGTRQEAENAERALQRQIRTAKTGDQR